VAPARRAPGVGVTVGHGTAAWRAALAAIFPIR
jgi:hypothetical protein